MTVCRLIPQAPNCLNLVVLATLVLLGVVSQSRVLSELERNNHNRLSSNTELGIDKDKLKILQANQNTASSKIQSVVCTRVRNEAPYLREWIEYHKMIGFEAFLLLNDNSTDDTQCILDAYAQEGLVIRLPQDIDNVRHNNVGKSNDHVFDICAKYINHHRQRRFNASQTWMSTHDVDEFIYFNRTSAVRTVSDAVSNLFQQHGTSLKSLLVPRLMFGSNHFDKYEPGLVIERFNKRSDVNSCDGYQMNATKGYNFDQSMKHHESQHQGRISYCKFYGRLHSYNNSKSFSNAASLAYRRCKKRSKGTKGKLARTRCSTTHNHTLRDPGSDGRATQRRTDYNSRVNDKRYLPQKAVGQVLVIARYLTRSRQEFMDRACESVWKEKYFQCDKCTTETYFNLAQEYANKFQDDRMAPFVTQLKQVMELSTIGSSCNTVPAKHPLEYYQECLERAKELR